MNSVPQQNAMLSLSDIAEMTRKPLPIVSNWRRRNNDFPEPVAEARHGGGLFDAAAVAKWLNSRGIHFDSREAHLAAMLWNLADGLRGDMAVEDLQMVLLEAATLVALDKKKSGDRVDERTSHVLRDTAHLPADAFVELVEATHGSQKHLVTTVIDYLTKFDRNSIVEAFDDIIGRGTTSRVGGTGEFWTPQSIAALMTSLSPADANVFYDPACGSGALLSTALSRSNHLTPQGLGQDVNRRALRIAHLRFALHKQDVNLYKGDTLFDDHFAGRLADVVLCDPPFSSKHKGQASSMDPRWQFGSPSSSFADLMWIQHAVAHLKLNGIGLVTSAMGTLFRAGREKDIRAELVRRGAVEAVIALPARMLPLTAIPVALWVLRNPDRHLSKEMLFVDASELGTKQAKRRVEVPPAAIDRLVTIVRRWHDSMTISHDDSLIAASVSRMDVLGADTNLVPARWIQKQQSPTDVARTQKEIAAILNRAATSLNSLATTPPIPLLTLDGIVDRSTISIERLLAEGALELVRSVKVRELEDDEGLPVVSASDVRGRDSATPNRFADVGDQRSHTRPGDVLLAAAAQNELAALVETEVRVPEYGVFALRIVGDWISPEALSQIITWDASAASTNSMATFAPLRAKDLSIPLLSEVERAQLSEFFKSLSDHARLAQTYSADLAELSEQIRVAVPRTAALHLAQSTHNR